MEVDEVALKTAVFLVAHAVDDTVVPVGDWGSFIKG